MIQYFDKVRMRNEIDRLRRENESYREHFRLGIKPVSGGGPDRIPSDESLADWLVPDPSPGNTTVGAGLVIGFTQDVIVLLNETNAASAEIRTLPDPPKAGLILGFTLQTTAGQNLVVRCSTPVWLGTTVTQPALTSLGQFITFSTANHSIFLQSVFCTKISFAGTQATFVNTTGARWMVMQSDGPTVT